MDGLVLQLPIVALHELLAGIKEPRTAAGALKQQWLVMVQARDMRVQVAQVKEQLVAALARVNRPLYTQQEQMEESV